MKFLLLAFLIISCSTSKNNDEVETVSLGIEKDSKLKIIDNNDLILDSANEKTKKNVNETKSMVTSLSVYSTLYSSLGLVTLFKQLEKKEIKISRLTANGFASVICALYAKELSSNSLEWKLFKLLKQIKNKKPYGKAWNEVVTDFIETEFKMTNLEQLKIPMHIPIIEEEGMKLVKTGSVVKTLKQALSISSKTNYFHKPGIFKENLMKFSKNLNSNITFMPKNIHFKLLDGYSWGILTNYFGFIMKNTEQIYQVKTDGKLAIDELVPLSDISAAYTETASIFVEKLSQDIESWQEENSTSSN